MKQGDPHGSLSGFTDGAAVAAAVTVVADVVEDNPTSNVLLVDGAPRSSGFIVSTDGLHTVSAEVTDCAGQTASASGTCQRQ